MHKPFYLVALLLLLLLSSTNAVSNNDEEKLSAAYIYNFSRFTTWPELPLSEHFTICIISEHSPGAALKALESRSINDRKIVVRSSPIPENIIDCAVVYLPHSNAQLQQQLIERVRHRPVLTISKGAAFVGKGGIIGLEILVEDRKFKQTTRLGFAINLKAAKQAGIKLSSKLLSLASEVRH